MYFETKVKRLNDYGKSVTEPYLVDALTCTEAEARITAELSPLYSDLEVVSVKQSKLSDFIFSDADYFYLVKANFPTVGEKTGIDKPNISAVLVQAKDFNIAKLAFEDFMAQSMADWEYVSIALTPIVDVFRYTPATETVE